MTPTSRATLSLKESHSSYWHESLGPAMAFIQNVWKDRSGNTIDSGLSIIRYASEVTPLILNTRWRWVACCTVLTNCNRLEILAKRSISSCLELNLRLQVCSQPLYWVFWFISNFDRSGTWVLNPFSRSTQREDWCTLSLSFLPRISNF